MLFNEKNNYLLRYYLLNSPLFVKYWPLFDIQKYEKKNI